MATYRIVRKFRDHECLNQTLATDQTLEEAQAHCNDPETSSKSCTDPDWKARTAQFGPWFDAYEEE